MQIRARHWFVAFMLASALHAGVLLAVDFGGGGPTVVGVGGGIRISLGDGTGTLGGGAPGAGEPSDADAGRPSMPSAPSPPEVAAAPPAPAPKVERAAPVEPIAPSERATAAADAASVVPVPLDAAPVPAPAPEPLQVAAVVANAPASEPAPLRSGARSDVASADSDGRGDGGSGNDGSASSGGGGARGDGGLLSDGSGQGGGEAGLAGLDPAYVRRFMASIERQKRYPRAAPTQRLEGTALLWLRLDRRGRVLAYDVKESSGHVLLDRAVVRTIEHRIRCRPAGELSEGRGRDADPDRFPAALRGRSDRLAGGAGGGDVPTGRQIRPRRPRSVPAAPRRSTATLDQDA